MTDFKELVIKVLDKYVNFSAINDIFNRLNESHRFYHNWDNHIEYMFKIAEKLGIKLTDMSECLKYIQVDFYEGLLTDYINSKDYDLTVVRGLRNGYDLEYEINQYHFMQDFKPDIKVISIFGDKTFDHVSSTSIRLLEQYGKGDIYLP